MMPRTGYIVKVDNRSTGFFIGWNEVVIDDRSENPYFLHDVPPFRFFCGLRFTVSHEMFLHVNIEIYNLNVKS